MKREYFSQVSITYVFIEKCSEGEAWSAKRVYVIGAMSLLEALGWLS